VLGFGPKNTTGSASSTRSVGSGGPKELPSFAPLDADTWLAKHYNNGAYLYAHKRARPRTARRRFARGYFSPPGATSLRAMSSQAERADYRNSRPGKRMGAGAVLQDSQGRVLLVRPSYKPGWEVPGGTVEFDESPRAACSRELAEELGHTRPVGRMLCMEWQGPEPDRTESLMFLYDGGVIDEGEIRLAAHELRDHRFVAEVDLHQYLTERLARRMGAALMALREECFVELERGQVVLT
jgi:8-oxo-dGTP diphosphatase